MKEHLIKMGNLLVEVKYLILKEFLREISKMVSKKAMEFTNLKHKFDMKGITKIIKKMEEAQL